MTRIFSRLYDRVLHWAAHRHATAYLAALSFAESSFFPVPPDVMLAPMALARPSRAFHLAGLTTLASAVGGAAGYLIGMLAFEWVEPLLHEFGYWEAFLRARQWFDEWGFWAIFVAGFSPIPYKVFTISAGVVGMSFPPFLVASIVGRGARFYLVAGLMRWGGERMRDTVRVYIDRVGWITVGLVLVLLVVLNT